MLSEWRKRELITGHVIRTGRFINNGATVKQRNGVTAKRYNDAKVQRCKGATVQAEGSPSTVARTVAEAGEKQPVGEISGRSRCSNGIPH